MKIAIYHNHYSKSSGEDVMFKLQCEALKSRGHDVLPVQAHVKDVLAKNSKFALAKMGFSAAHNPAGLKIAREAIESFNPDIAHVHNWFPIFSPAIYEAHFEKGIPVVQTLHNYRLGCATGNFRYEHAECESCLTHGRAQSITKKCYQGSALGSFFWKRTIDRNFGNGNFTHRMLHYVCPSQEVFQRHLKIGIPEKSMTVIPNACDDPLEGGTIPERQKVRVLYLGRLVPEKGVGTLLCAWKLLLESLHAKRVLIEPELSIVGEGSDRDKLVEEAAQMQGVRFHGYLPHLKAQELLRRSPIVVFPSCWPEPFGLGVIEGMAAGCGVISSDVGGPSELIRNGETGLLFKSGDPKDLCKRLLQLMEAPQETLKLGRNGRKEYLKKYQPSSHGTQLEQYYETIIS